VLDLLGRLRDQVIEPMRSTRQRAKVCAERLLLLNQIGPGIDVDPMTRQLRKRMQERSVLYLMGPGRLIDRQRGAPALLSRLPRSTWDLIRGKSKSAESVSAIAVPAITETVPDFRATAVDQFRVSQARIADVLEASGFADDAASWRLDPELAGRIIDDELADLRKFLEERWTKSPRDTLILFRLLKFLPGGEKLAKATEAAPYLLVLACAAHHAVMGPIDILVIGGFTLATWLGEKLSSEVAQRTRQSNRNIDSAYAQLVRNQLQHAVEFVQKRQPDPKHLDALEAQADSLQSACEAV